MSAATIPQAVAGTLIVIVGVTGLHAILARSVRVGPTSDGTEPGPGGADPGSVGADPGSGGIIVPLVLLTVTGLLIGSLLLGAVGLAAHPVAYEVLFGVSSVALAAFGRVRPAAFRPRWHVPGRTILLASVPVLLLTVAIGLSWWSDSTTINAPVTALGATRTPAGLEVTVTRSGGDGGELRVEVIGTGGRQWRPPPLPRRDKVDVDVADEIGRRGPTTVRLLIDGRLLRSVTVP